MVSSAAPCVAICRLQRMRASEFSATLLSSMDSIRFTPGFADGELRLLVLADVPGRTRAFGVDTAAAAMVKVVLVRCRMLSALVSTVLYCAQPQARSTFATHKEENVGDPHK